jgi:hypothetical protein
VTRFLGLVGVAATFSCAGAPGPVFATSERFPEQPRRAPSFAAEPAFASPGHAEAAPAAGSAVAAPFGIQPVQVPLDSEAARGVVSRFFIAVLRESTRELFPLLATQSSVLSEGSRQPAQAVWRARFAQLDYTSLSGRVVAAPQTLRTYTFASSARAKLDGVPTPASANEVVVVARPGLSWAGKTRLFGEALAFRLRPKAFEQSFEIAEIVEDFRLP